MNEKVIKAVASLRAFFPTFTKEQTAAYSRILDEYPSEVVSSAIKELVKTETGTYAPPVGRICQMCDKIIAQATGEVEFNAADGWREVMHVVCDVSIYRLGEYKWKDKVAEECARALTIEALMNMQLGTEEDVMRSNFLKMYEGKARQVKKRMQVNRILSDGKITEAIQAVIEKFEAKGGRMINGKQSIYGRIERKRDHSNESVLR